MLWDVLGGVMIVAMIVALVLGTNLLVGRVYSDRPEDTGEED